MNQDFALLHLRREDMTVKHFHLFGGAGFGARGFQSAHVRVGTLRAKMECLGGIDYDASACRAFEQFVGVPETHLDLFSRDQYIAYHGKEPPKSWRPARPEDIRRAAGGQTPDIVFTSPPCRGFSGLLSAANAKSLKYQALNELTVRGIELALRAWADDPVPLFLLENVPRIEQRGGFLLDQIEYWLRFYGYATVGFPHNCGELGGLAQNRRRFLLVARHREKVPPYLYEPPKRRVRGVGEVLKHLPPPDSKAGGRMHRLPSLEWQTWVRLAFVEAGKDWRSLRRLEVKDGVLRDFVLLPENTSWVPGVLGVKSWDEPSSTVTGRSSPSTGAFAVADPGMPSQFSKRTGRENGYGQYGVKRWEDPAATITAHAGEPGSGPFGVADPRLEAYGTHSGKLHVTEWDSPARTVTTSDRVGSGAQCVQDPRPSSSWAGQGKYRVTAFDEPAGTVLSTNTGVGAFAVADPGFDGARTPFNNVFRVVRWDEASQAVTGGATPTSGGQAVADPMPYAWKDGKRDYATGGHYGVVRWEDPSVTVTGHAEGDRGRFSVADGRGPYSPKDRPKQSPVIIAEDGTWHRPMSTLELAALQGAPWEVFAENPLQGTDTENRMHIGNGVPVTAAQTIAEEMVLTLLLARAGVSERIDDGSIWVRQASIALSLDL